MYIFNPCIESNIVQRKILARENIDEFDEFPAIRQYFPYQNFHLVRYLPLMNLWQFGST